MRKLLISALLCSLTIGVEAQSYERAHRGIESFGRHGQTVSLIERTAAKQNYRYRMKGFRTSDNYQFVQFLYNEQLQLVAVKDSVRNEYSLIDSLFYNEFGQMVRLSGWQLLGGEWQNVYYVDYGYNEAGLIASRSNYNNFDGEWELGGVYTYTYNEAGKILLSELTMNGILFQKVEYTYDQDGNELCAMWYSYDGLGLTPSEKVVSVYENGLKITEYDSVCEGGVRWMNDGYTSYSYNNSNDCLEYHHYDETNYEVERSVYSFNSSRTMDETLIPWHPELVRPKTYQNTHVYEMEEWFTVDVDYVLQHVCDYIYEYEDVNVLVDEVEPGHVAVYPNPAHDYIIVKGLGDESCRVEIIDALGREVLVCESASNGQRLAVGQLPEGCYVLTVSTAKGSFASKLLIK